MSKPTVRSQIAIPPQLVVSEASIPDQLAALQSMTASQLQTRYQQVFGEQSRSGNRQWLLRRVAWRIQALAEGGLSERALKRAAELARDADIRVRPPKVRLTVPPRTRFPVAVRTNVASRSRARCGEAIFLHRALFSYANIAALNIASLFCPTALNTTAQPIDLCLRRHQQSLAVIGMVACSLASRTHVDSSPIHPVR